MAVAAPREAAEPLLPAPTPVESVDQLMAAAKLAESAAERQSLLNAAVAASRACRVVAEGWAAATRVKVKRALDADLGSIDRTSR